MVEAPDLADQVGKRLVDVDPLLGRRLDEPGPKVPCEFPPLVCAHLALVFEVALVGHDDDGEVVFVFDAQDLGSSVALSVCLAPCGRQRRRRRTCWWNVEISSNELRLAIE